MNQDLLITAIAAVFAIISPVVIQWRKNPDWNQTLRVALPVAVSVVISVVYLWSTGGFAGLNFVAAFLAVYGLQQIVYVTIVKHIQSLHEQVSLDESELDDPQAVEEVEYDETTGVMITGHETDQSPVDPGYEAKHRA